MNNEIGPSLQFLGAFVGGLGAGVLLGRVSEAGVLLAAAIFAGAWCLVLTWLSRDLGRPAD